MEFTIEGARSYIEQVRWQFAKTMPQWPHEYTVRHWRPELDQGFVEFVLLIRREGTIKPWPREAAKPRYHHTYLELDGWEYWTMGEPVEDTVVINRALPPLSAVSPHGEGDGINKTDPERAGSGALVSHGTASGSTWIATQPSEPEI